MGLDAKEFPRHLQLKKLFSLRANQVNTTRPLSSGGVFLFEFTSTLSCTHLLVLESAVGSKLLVDNGSGSGCSALGLCGEGFQEGVWYRATIGFR